MIIFIDADACPVKEEVVHVANRYGLEVYMVSNQMLRSAMRLGVKHILVGKEFDAADNWIADHINAADITITADIQLAARCLQKKAKALNSNGHIFTKENIGFALAMRELNAYLRESGEIKGTNKPFTARDRSEFLQSLDKLIQQAGKR